MIKSGCFDEFGLNRSAMMDSIDDMVECCKIATKIRKEMDCSLFGEDEGIGQVQVKVSQNTKEWETKKRLKFEQEVTGIYLTGHPLQDYKDEIDKVKYLISSSFDEVIKDGDAGSGLIVGKIEEVTTRITKKGTKMASINILDLHGNIEAVAFERELNMIQELKDAAKAKMIQELEDKGEMQQALELKKSPDIDLEQPYAFKVSIGRDGQFLRIKINEILSLEEAAENGGHKFKKYGERKDSWSYTEKSLPKPTGTLELVLELSKIDKRLVARLYKLCVEEAKQSQDQGNKQLIIKVKTKDDELLYHTDFIVRDEFISKTQEELLATG